MEKVNIYCDGASRGNGSSSAKAAWAVVIYIDGQKDFEYGNYEVGATNNKMELSGLLSALFTALEFKDKVPEVTILCDSNLAVRGFNEWIYSWYKNKTLWTRPNSELWLPINMIKNKLWVMKDKFKVNVVKIKGHVGHMGNEAADAYCNQLMDAGIETEYKPMVPINRYNNEES